MSSKKIKVFLAAFTNQTNAQNLSCRALAKYLDKDKFQVYTLAIKHGNLPTLQLDGVVIFYCGFPVKLTGILGFIWGFFHADVVYLPRGNFINWQRFLTRIFKVETFKTVRNVIDDEALKTAMSQLIKPTKGDLKKAYNFVDRVYAMTPYMSEYNYKRWGLNSEKITLLPPTDFEMFSKSVRVRSKLHKLVFIGNDWKRKGINDFLALADLFPDLEFHVIGRGNQKEYAQSNLKNVFFHGLLTEDVLVRKIQTADLHILPSRSEGLPRVWLEALANGLPSVLFKGYGAEDFVHQGKTGYVVEKLTDAEEIISGILNQSISLKELSEACIEDAKNYHPAKLTKQYERVIESLYVS